jgi:hypothetical protein
MNAGNYTGFQTLNHEQALEAKHLLKVLGRCDDYGLELWCGHERKRGLHLTG